MKELFDLSCDDMTELWQDLEDEKVGVYKMDGFFLVISLTATALFVEHMQGSGVFHSRYCDALIDFAKRCGKNQIICNVNSRLEKVYRERYNFVVLNRSKRIVFGIAQVITTMARFF